MATLNTVELSHGINYKKAEIMTDEIEWIMVAEAAEILGVSGRSGVHYILRHLPENAPEVRRQTLKFGKNKIHQYAKSDIEALREYRNSNNN